MLSEGEKAPEFSLQNSNGDTVTLSSLRGRTVVLYFYPRDNTPGCTIEAQQFTALAEEFEAKNAVVAGISKDSVESHCSFVEKYALSVVLLSDSSGGTVESYGAWREKNRYGKKYMGIVRCTYIVDADGVIVRTWDNVKASGHAQAVLESL